MEEVRVLFWTLLICFATDIRAHSGHHGQDKGLANGQEHGHQNARPQAHISDHRFFLHEIFTKYGHNGQMTFEGFEHLLESLGLGNIIINDHDLSLHKEDAFQSTHDTHDHSKKDDHSHEEDRHETTAHQATGSTAGGKILSTLRQTTPPSTVSVENLLYKQRTSALPSGKPSTHKPSDSQTPDTNGETLGSEHIYHYRIANSEIPELLVNISSLVDQHQELENQAHEMVIEQCLSPKEILETFGINQTSSLNPVSFLHLCPAIIYELDQGHCMFRGLSHKKNNKLATFYQWMYALLAVLVISLCGLLSVAVIPIMQKWFYQTLLQFLVGLAVGSLSGDGLLHLMPHAMLPGEHGGGSLLIEVAEKTAVWRGFTALGGILFFFVAERLLAAITSRKKTVKKTPEVTSSEVPDTMFYSEGRVGQKLSDYRKDSQIDIGEKEMMHMLSHSSDRKQSLVVTHLSTEHGHGHSHEVPESITAVAWMVIMGDGLHNFCDGLAIGAAFASGIEGGISTTVAVFCHELPHELGDFAMLLRTGMDARKALLYNVLSSALCLAGTAIGLCLGGVTSATGWVFAATAGIFLYVALVDMLPELTASGDPNVSQFHQLGIQVLGISTGVSIMLLIANYEQELQFIVS